MKMPPRLHDLIFHVTCDETPDVMRYLKRHGDGWINEVHDGHRGDTLLIIAASRNNVATAKLLLEHGAHIDATNDLGETALMQAAYYNYPEMVAFLIERGAMLTSPTSKGESVACLAEIFGRKESAALIRAAEQTRQDKNVRARIALAADLPAFPKKISLRGRCAP